jgi:NAD-dependent deacetylase
MSLSPQESEKIDAIVKLLKQSQSLLFITGAGISAESGLPTYRGIGGLYNNNEPTTEGVPIEVALSGATIKTNPSLTWKYLVQIEEKCRNATFNRAHEIIAQMGQHFERVWVLTQNIDGLHHAAGSGNVIDIHGNMHKLLCPRCGWRMTVQDYSKLTIPPHCPLCDHIVRPEVVFFGEQLPYKETQILYAQVKLGFDIYFSIGTTSIFPYIQEPIFHAKALKRPTIEINPTDTEISQIVDIKLPLKAAEALEAIWQQYKTA